MTTSRPALRVLALASLLAAIILPTQAPAQSSPPSGNAHPQTEAVADFSGGNPFGQVPGGAEMDPAAKKAFADRLQASGALEPLRNLAVFNRGRVKILDTLSRESIRAIAGRKNYYDLIPTSNGNASRAHYDPLFTYFDMAIDPVYYEDKPLLYIDYLPLREAFIKKAYTDADEQEWWKKQGRLKPQVIELFGGELARKQDTRPDLYARAISSLVEARSLYHNGWHNLDMVAPESASLTWQHVGALPPDSPVRRAFAEMGAAWRAGDAERVKAAASVIAADLPTINPQVYPGSKRSLELAYNASNPFEWGYWLYFLSLVSLILAFGTSRRWLAGLGIATLIAAVGLHAFGFVSRCIIAERFAIQNQFESMTGLSLFATVVGLTIMLLRRQWLFGAAAAGVGFMVLITATQTNIPGVNIEREAAILNTSVLLKYHVTTVLVSYGLISLGFITSLFYLATYYATRRRTQATLTPAAAGAGGVVDLSAQALGLDDEAPKGPKRVLADLDKAQMIILQLAFWCLGVGILLGAWWADHSWGRWWGFDPKEVWALITWIVYLVVVHIRVTNIGSRGLITAWLSVLGFFIMLWCYFGVNLILPGLHAYA
ncbi:MAG: cytochrome c biogenesis protein CcsA [Phycisphaeraceae bacterium]|nr:cytochrome c biogenesis protein CcsA [Phycisphaeraceae bacterium]